jgi:hypothetical protein
LNDQGKNEGTIIVTAQLNLNTLHTCQSWGTDETVRKLENGGKQETFGQDIYMAIKMKERA